MRAILLLLPILLGMLGCHHFPRRSAILFDQSCYDNGNLSASERKQIYPFNVAAKVVVISFDRSKYDYVFGKINGDTTVTEEDTMALPHIRDRIILNAMQIDRLTDVLYNFNYSKRSHYRIEDVSCWNPRHAILFLNASEVEIGNIEICFECHQIESTLPKESVGDFCDGKLTLLKDYFVSMGVKYFED